MSDSIEQMIENEFNRHRSQWDMIKGLGFHSHFPLVITRKGRDFYTGVGPQVPPIVQVRYVFLKSYSESFESTWNTPTRAFGRLNPDYRYLQTNRKITMSFTLPARNVADSKENLDFCSNMSRIVYGNYQLMEDSRSSLLSETSYGHQRYQYTGVNLNTKLWFGNLIQKEFVVFTNFSFKPNFDAGVFEYSNTQLSDDERLRGLGQYQEDLYSADSSELDEKSYVYHSDIGIVYPKQVDVECSVIVLHQDPLGFGGIRRSPNSIKWAMNYDMHWPHNVPETDIPSYMRSTSETIATPPEHVEESPPPTDASNDEEMAQTISSQPSPRQHNTFDVESEEEDIDVSIYIDENGVAHRVETE